jgi:tellurite resistance protein TehA-like permease
MCLGAYLMDRSKQTAYYLRNYFITLTTDQWSVSFPTGSYSTLLEEISNGGNTVFAIFIVVAKYYDH